MTKASIKVDNQSNLKSYLGKPVVDKNNSKIIGYITESVKCDDGFANLTLEISNDFIIDNKDICEDKTMSIETMKNYK